MFDRPNVLFALLTFFATTSICVQALPTTLPVPAAAPDQDCTSEMVLVVDMCTDSVARPGKSTVDLTGPVDKLLTQIDLNTGTTTILALDPSKYDEKTFKTHIVTLVTNTNFGSAPTGSNEDFSTLYSTGLDVSSDQMIAFFSSIEKVYAGVGSKIGHQLGSGSGCGIVGLDLTSSGTLDTRGFVLQGA
ncbi:hypothetical protein SISNIDRAFT_491002 [Sistotremastrum niveocremeum HHB9708]|uniref:Uncharacterized protein n=1 Tax=Sistotremastrum niveocremeum HHB9708 TaxID=1314777 RepID=A0A164NBA9_9AGAM|nr:hypothetical protein SISNIDRAFT_491002 [Sistotremastrum niveocremeum HHB9708]